MHLVFSLDSSLFVLHYAVDVVVLLFDCDDRGLDCVAFGSDGLDFCAYCSFIAYFIFDGLEVGFFGGFFASDCLVFVVFGVFGGVVDVLRDDFCFELGDLFTFNGGGVAVVVAGEDVVD